MLATQRTPPSETPSLRPDEPGDRRRLTDLSLGHRGSIAALDLPPDDARRLMELGFLPGVEITYCRRSPFGDPRVFRIDDAEVALRRETASHVLLQAEGK